MRFELQLSLADKPLKQIPLYYQHHLSSWVFKIFERGNPNLMQWLRDQEIQSWKEILRNFTFSQFKIPENESKIEEDRLTFFSNQIRFQLSFYADNSLDDIILNLFNKQRGFIADQKSGIGFQCIEIEKIQTPEFTETMKYKAITPIVLEQKSQSKRPISFFISPDNQGYGGAFCYNLYNRYNRVKPEAVFKPEDIRFQAINKPEENIVTFRTTRDVYATYSGYLFDFELTAPVELQKFGYYAGFGKENSHGFGFTEHNVA